MQTADLGVQQHLFSSEEHEQTQEIRQNSNKPHKQRKQKSDNN